MDDLNEKQKIFCNEYIIDFNATRSYSVAFNRKKDETARVEACKLLTKPNIKQFIESVVNERVQALGITQEYVLNGIKDIAENEESTKSEKIKSLELLGKYLKLFTEKVEHTGNIANIEPIKIEFIKPKKA